MTGLLDKVNSVISQTERKECVTGPNDREKYGERDYMWFILTGPHGVRKGRGTNELERCRGQIAQSLVCKEDFDSYQREPLKGFKQVNDMFRFSV